MPDPSSTARCEAWCIVAGTQVECTLPNGHPYEHEVDETIDVRDQEDTDRTTTFLVWWGDDGHAFVGSKDAVNTGGIT